MLTIMNTTQDIMALTIIMLYRLSPTSVPLSFFTINGGRTEPIAAPITHIKKYVMLFNKKMLHLKTVKVLLNLQ